MIFNEILGLKSRIDGAAVIVREAVRAVIIQDNKILMVSNNKGDYKLPGGGIENQEAHGETLKREVLEETGYLVKSIGNKIGLITERRKDPCVKNAVFEMNSHYYCCEVYEDQGRQKLDHYEAKLEFRPRWISIEGAIKRNHKAVVEIENTNSWVARELYVLNSLKEHLWKNP